MVGVGRGGMLFLTPAVHMISNAFKFLPFKGIPF